MTVQQLKIFLAVCRELNFTRAAESLFITRQALRQSISTLENELGAPLFYMESNRISLTDLGEKLREHAAPVVDAFIRLEDDMRSGSTKRSLRVGISVSLIPDYLPRLMDYLRIYADRNPSIELTTSILPNDSLEQALRENRLDCALQLDLGCCGEGIVRTELSSHHPALLISRQNPLWERSSITVQDLCGLNICVPGTGPAFSPLINAAQADINIVESFYQVYYLVREKHICAINRYDATKDISGLTRDVPISDLPYLCCAFITSGNRSSETVGLEKHLRREIGKYFSTFTA